MAEEKKVGYVQAIGSYYLCKIDEAAETSEGGMSIAHSKGEKTESVAVRAIVISVPEGEEVTPAQEGDVVWLAKWEIHHIGYQAVRYICAKKEHIIARLSYKKAV